MLSKMKDTQKKFLWWHIALVVVTLLAALPKIYIGIDNDEAYIVTLGVRLLNGDRIFDTMWELHMTSAWPAFLGLVFYRFVTGSLEGAVIFLRALSTILQFAVAWMTYRIFDKYKSRDVAVLAGVFIANFLPRATQNLEYGLLEMLFVLVTLLLLYDELMCRKETGKTRGIRIVLAGIAYALGVLAYPTIVISFPVILIALYVLQEKEKKRFVMPLMFAVVCAGCAVIFLGIVFSYLPITEFLGNLQGILADGTHSDTVKTQTYIPQLVELIKRGGLMFLVSFVMWLVYRKWEKDKLLLWYGLLLAGCLIFVGLNITGLRPSGPIGLQIRYIIPAIAALQFAYLKKDSMLTGLFLAPGWAIYIGAMIGSNMGFEENASFLYPVVLGAVIIMTEYARERSVWFYRAGVTCVASLLVGIIFSKGYLVRVTGTYPSNIMEERYPIVGSMLDGIYVTPQELETHKNKESEIKEYSDEEDCILYLGNNAICNTFTEGSFTSATCISTPVYNEEWVMYYENEKHSRPTIVFIDKDAMETLDEFMETEFGVWMSEHYECKEDEFIEAEAFYILRLN